MRKAAGPDPDPTTKRDAVGSECGHGVSDETRPVPADGTFGHPPPDHSPNDFSLHDAWLVEHTRHGDHQAFALLVRRYKRKLLRVLTRLIRDPEHARDLRTETFWRVYIRLNRFDTSRRFGPWLFRVAINLGLDWLRHSKYEPPLSASVHRAGSNSPSTFEVPDADPRTQAELAQEVQFILGLMPVSYRTILVLRDLEGFSTSEVAAIVGRRESTVRWKLSVPVINSARSGNAAKMACDKRSRMLNQELGVSMSNRKCRWVRARLPLWVGDGGSDMSAKNSGGWDLVAEDRCEIERHLADCASCRGRQNALQQAVSTLAAASTLAPVDPYVTSLWPTLERRIQDQDAIAASQRAQKVSGLVGWMQHAWAVRDRTRPRLGSILLYGAAASFVVTSVTFAIARRQWLDAQSRIVGNSSPLARVAAPASALDETSSRISAADDDGEASVNHLAEADPVRLPEASAPGILPSKPAIHGRLGYDLDHGTLVTPDTRESKPIY